jgi:hypothetical protein
VFPLALHTKIRWRGSGEVFLSKVLLTSLKTEKIETKVKI